MPSVDEACDHALAASKMAMATHADDHHKAAKQANEAAHGLASAAGRPSLAQSHLQAAALHDRHADPTTPEGKSSAAHRATAKARQPGAKPEDHDAAAAAHDDAAKAHEDAGMPKASMQHRDQAFQHKAQASRLRNPPQRPGGPMPDGY